jgi:creatinine amidohydrolase
MMFRSFSVSGSDGIRRPRFRRSALWFRGLVLVLAAGWLLAAAKGQTKPPRPSLDAASGGYSIFHETMVDMAWPEVEKAAKDGAVVLMTTAVIEEHGPHMSCGIDTYLGYFLCKLTRRELESRGVKAVIAPPFFWGVNSATHVFPGSFAIRPETMKALLGDIFVSLKSMGFRHVFNINAHGDGQHKRATIEAILEAQKQTGLDIRYLVPEDDVPQMGLTGEPPSWVLLHKMPPDEGTRTPYLDIHAGAGETGIVAAFYPGLVNEPLAKTLPPTRLTGQNVGEWLKDARRVTPSGYVGDPAKYDVEEAQAYVPEWCRMMAEAIAGFLRREEHRKQLSQLDFDALDRKRDEMLRQYRLLDVGGVKPGMVVGEVGAGDGYLTFHLAARVGPSGKVYANDIIEERTLEVIRSRAAKKGIAHIETILGMEDDPRFPKDSLEAVFMLNAFHEIRDPVALLRNLVPSLKAGAKVIIHEWEAQSPGAIGPSGDRTYTRQEFLDIISRSPFEVESVDTSFPGTHPAVYVLSVKAGAKKGPGRPSTPVPPTLPVGLTLTANDQTLPSCHSGLA